MRFFRQSKVLDHKTVCKWIRKVSNGHRRQFHAMRKNVQAAMLNEIATHFLTSFTDEDGQAAYLAIHVFSGRTKLKPVLLEVDENISRRAESLFQTAISQPPPTEQFELTCVFNCSLEITNEAQEQHYTDALVLANHGLKYWPQYGELWQQRGVLRLTQGDFTGAIEDLYKARAISPNMLWINEPIRYAESRLQPR